MTLEMFKEAVKKDGWIIVQKNKYIYFKRRDPSKAYNQGAMYSCRTTDMEEAMETIKKWIAYGFPETKEERKKNDVSFVDYLKSFWDEESLYFKSAAIEGRHWNKNYIKNNQQYIRCFIQDFFKDMRLSYVNENILNRFFDSLIMYKSDRTGRHLAGCTINKIKSGVLLPLKWGRRKGIIKQVIDFVSVCPGISDKATRNRGILTIEETAKLLLHDWTDRKAYIGFCIAVNCGLRVGEIRALKIGSVQNGFLIVNHSYNDTDGIKSTKTGKSRIVPCPDDVLQLINNFISDLPPELRESECFLFADDFKPSEPVGKSFFITRFYTAMRQCGIKRERENPLTGEKEVIVFHSLRHQTATRWVESGIDLRLIAEAMGHNVEMLQHYSDHLGKNDMAILRHELAESNKLGAANIAGKRGPLLFKDNLQL